MDRIRIRGGNRLNGTIPISGAKNAALKLLAAATRHRLHWTELVAHRPDVKLEGAAVKLGLAGTASIPARELDLKGTASLVAPPKPGAATFELPFIVRWNR